MKKLVTAPARLPVYLAEAKAAARIDEDVEDAMLDAWITEATQFAEMYTGRALITQTWDFYFDAFPVSSWTGDSYLEIPASPLQSVVSVGYLDVDEAEQVMPAADYRVDVVNEPGRVVLKTNKSWPQSATIGSAVFIRAVVGYGAFPGDVPEVIRNWIREQVVYRHAVRTRSILGANGGIDMPAWMGIDALSVYRAGWV